MTSMPVNQLSLSGTGNS